MAHVNFTVPQTNDSWLGISERHHSQGWVIPDITSAALSLCRDDSRPQTWRPGPVLSRTCRASWLGPFHSRTPSVLNGGEQDNRLWDWSVTSMGFLTEMLSDLGQNCSFSFSYWQLLGWALSRSHTICCYAITLKGHLIPTWTGWKKMALGPSKARLPFIRTTSTSGS